MKIIAQIPLLLFSLIAYCCFALITPESLNLSIAEQPEVETVIEETAPTAVDEFFAPSTAKPVFVMQLISGAKWGPTLGEILIVVSLLLLFVEIFKSTRVSTASIIDHMLSTFVFIIHIVLFLIWDRAGSATFFILTTITMIDVLCGFTVSISSARRDVSFGEQGIL